MSQYGARSGFTRTNSAPPTHPVFKQEIGRVKLAPDACSFSSRPVTPIGSCVGTSGPLPSAAYSSGSGPSVPPEASTHLPYTSFDQPISQSNTVALDCSLTLPELESIPNPSCIQLPVISPPAPTLPSPTSLPRDPSKKSRWRTLGYNRHTKQWRLPPIPLVRCLPALSPPRPPIQSFPIGPISSCSPAGSPPPS